MKRNIYFLDLVSEKNIRNQLNKIRLQSFILFILFLSIGFILYFIFKILSFAFIFLSIITLFILLSTNEEKIRDEITKNEERKLKSKLINILSIIATMIYTEKGDNMVFYLRRASSYDDSILNEITRMYDKNERIKNLNVYFKDKLVVKFLSLMDELLYEYDANKIDRYFEEIKNISDSIVKVIEIKTDEKKEKSDSFNTVLIALFSIFPIFVMGGILLFLYPKFYNIIISIIILLSSILFFFFMFLLVSLMIKRDIDNLFD
jgi:hypothetical protein